MKKKRIIKQRQSLAEKQPGTTIFPISRIKRIIKADKELDMMTGEASFVVAVATVCLLLHVTPVVFRCLSVSWSLSPPLYLCTANLDGGGMGTDISDGDRDG